jgi:hypothetical protein
MFTTRHLIKHNKMDINGVIMYQDLVEVPYLDLRQTLKIFDIKSTPHHIVNRAKLLYHYYLSGMLEEKHATMINFMSKALDASRIIDIYVDIMTRDYCEFLNRSFRRGNHMSAKDREMLVYRPKKLSVEEVRSKLCPEGISDFVPLLSPSFSKRGSKALNAEGIQEFRPSLMSEEDPSITD